MREAGSVSSSSAPTLARTTYDRLRADVLTGRWPPGSKLPMHELRSHYGVGASPLREALNRLASEDWVVHHDQRGFTVAAASRAQLDDLVDTRIAVESLTLDRAMARMGAADEERLVVSFHRLSRTPRSLDGPDYQENPDWEALHRDFHRALLEPCGSALLLGFCDQLYDHAYRYRQLAASRSHRQRHELDEHRALLDAVLGRRLDEAQQLLAAHYRRTAELCTFDGVDAWAGLAGPTAAGR